MSVHPKAAHLRQPGAIGDKGSRPGIPGEFPIQPRPGCIYVLIVVGDDLDCSYNYNQDGLSRIKQNLKINRK